MILKRIILVFLTGIVLIAGSSFKARPSDAEEYVIKAAFLYRFIDYIEWSSSEPRETFNISVLGNSGITRPLKEIASNKMAKNTRIVVRQSNDLNDMGSCRILFVSKNSTVPLETVIAAFADRPVLIVAEQRNACERGAHINFLIQDGKLKFQVNLKTVSRSGLKISSQVLQHASDILH